MDSILEFDISSLQLYADNIERLLICCHSECGFALSTARSQATSHLRDKHNIPRDIRDGLTRYLKHKHPYSFRNPADVDPREDGSQVHRMLRIYEGFACRECSYRTINYAEYSRHASKEHLSGGHASRQRVDPYYDDVYLQTWTQGSSRRYWTVKKNGSTIRPVAGRGVSEHIAMARQREHARAEEQQWMHSTNTTAGTLAGTRPWMERTRWEITYQGLRWDILRNLTQMPRKSLWVDYVLGPGSNPTDPEFVSPKSDEARIALLMVAVDHMLDRCEETMQHTGRNILCWLRSTKPQACYPKPFTLVALESSKRKYRQLFQRCLAFLFRASRMSADIRRHLLGVRFNKIQLRQIRAILEHRAWSETDLAQDKWPGSRVRDGEEDESEDEEDIDEENEYEIEEGEDRDDEEIEGGVEGEKSDDDNDDTDGEESASNKSEKEYEEKNQSVDNDSSAVDELLELVFQLSITFSTEEFVDSQPSSSMLVYFSGILGFSPDARSFQPAKNYTPHLSALIYIQRLLFLEYALPLRPYTHLGIPRRSRFQQQQHFDIIRQRYMITGSSSPLEEFQSLRDFGRVIARTDPPSFLLRWSDDRETVSYGDEFSLTMDSFRGLAEHFLVKAEALCDELMFGLNPEIDLAKVKDDLTNTQYGFSFVRHPANKLADAYLDLSARACTTRRNGLFRNNQWDWKAIFSYRKKAESLLEMIEGMFQTGGGQFARVSELDSLECENGSSTERGLYIYNGFLIFITRHHKAKRSTNREFNVVRFLHVRGGHVVFKYLVYIRRFLEMLRREQFSYPDPDTLLSSRNLLFRSDQTPHKPWNSSHFTSILKRATKEVWNISINTQLYRQLTIGITEKHVQEVHKPFNRFDDKTATADVNVVFAWQSGHRPIQRATTYGLDGAFPAQLQPALLRVYEWASTRWHEFLHQPSRVMPPPKAVAVRDDAPSLSLPLLQQPLNTNPRPEKRQRLPWNCNDIDDDRPAKRRAEPERQELPILSIDSVQRPSSEVHSAGESLAVLVARQPPRLADIILQVEAWEDGAAVKPVSDDEGDSPIDWDEPDMIPSNAPSDGSRPSWSREPWPSWQRHKRRIETKIDCSRQFHSVFDVEELRPQEQAALRNLQRSLDLWSRCCVICDFTGNPAGRRRHSPKDCPDRLSRPVQTLAPLLLTKLQQLAGAADTQSCPMCLVPRLLCNRWKQEELDKWADIGDNCQYDQVVVFTIVTALEGAAEIRDELDVWMDSYLYSRNLDKVCQWLSGRTIGNDLCALRVLEVFQLVSSAWGRLNSINQGYHSPRLSWITSTGPASTADDAADKAAYKLRELKGERNRARIRREGRDTSDLAMRLLSWMEKCPICFTRRRAGYDLSVDHTLEICTDKQQQVVIAEIVKLQAIDFAAGTCCNRCAVPQEICEDSTYLLQKEKEKCLYNGIVREAVAAMFIVSPDIVVEKIYAWMRSEGIWTGNIGLSKEETQQVMQMMLKWFSQKATWREFRASVLVQVFNQLDRWVEAFGKGLELEDWYRAD